MFTLPKRLLVALVAAAVGGLAIVAPAFAGAILPNTTKHSYATKTD